MTPDPTPAASWTGPSLLVPVALDALVITVRSFQDLPWSWNAPNYNEVRFFGPVTGILQGTQPEPITPDGHVGRTGTVLRWALPDALTNAGSPDGATGALTFPAIPNRWLIQRRSAGVPAATMSWILASDYVDGTGSSFPVGSAASTLGRCWELPDWPGEAALPPGLQPPLTALGAGDPSFAAFAPNVQHILSFHDPLLGVAPGPVSYLLVGWYAGQAPDPLGPQSGWATAEDWASLMNGLGWSVGDDLAQASAAAQAWAAARGLPIDPANPKSMLASRVICHGELNGLTWLGADGAPQSGVPKVVPGNAATLPMVTIAHTPADALATVVATAAGQQSTQVAEALTALLSDLLPLLDEPDGPDQLALNLQHSWFQQLPGGLRWAISEPEHDDAPTGHTDTPLTPGQAALLDSLNDAQAALDASARQLATLQWETYALWWKLRYIMALGANPIPNARQVTQAAFDAKTGQTTRAIADWRSARGVCAQAQRALAAAQLGDLVLKSVPEPVFWRPSDPVLMIQGVGRSYAHGEDGRYTQDGSLYCRFTGQTISALLVSGTSVPVTAPTLRLPALTAIDTPAELNDLAIEAYFLDPSNAAAIASAADPAAPQPASVVAAQQTLMWNSLTDVPLDQQTLAEAAGLESEFGPVAVPSKIGVNYWSPPWAPLFLDWSLSYYPTGPAQSGWRFPALNPTDPLQGQTAQWTGTKPQTVAPMQGRTLLTPQATDAMAARLVQLVQQFGGTPEIQPYLADLNDAIEYLRDACVLSQSLSGFTDLLLQRDPTLFQHPDLTELGPWLTPADAPAFNPAAAPSPATSMPFTPVGGGFLALAQLWVVDALGQRYDVLESLNHNPSPHGQQLGPDLVPSIGSGLFPVRPRLSQASRLQLRFLDAQDDTSVVGRSATANPLCGWMIPNRLDNGVLTYDTAGILQGELVVERNKALWLPAPDEVPASSQSQPPALANPHLNAIVNGILSNPNSGGALTDLINTIQQASWAISTDGPGADHLSALVGFPVAVVRAQLRLELSGPAATGQLWATTGHDDDSGISQVAFTVQLGSTELFDDSLIGALTDDNTGHLLSPYGPTANGYATTGVHTVQTDQPLELTVLMHPQGKIHAFSGILPPTAASLPAVSQLAPSNAMEVTFRSGPLLTPATGTAAPLPTFGTGDWSWLQYQNASAPATPRPIMSVDATAHMLDAAPTLREGWLRLTLTDQPTVLTYALTPAVITAGTGTAPTTTTIVLTAFNGSGTPVRCGAIRVGIPVGAGQSALTLAPERIAAASGQPTTWTVLPAGSAQPGVFLAAASDPAGTVDPGATLTFVFSDIDVNSITGVVLIGIDELTAGTNHLDLPLEKLAAW